MKAQTALLAFVLVAPIWAQMGPPGGIPWWERPMRRDLGLSADQDRQIGAILLQHRSEFARLRESVEMAEAELAETMNASTIDVGRANEGIEKVVAARSELMRKVAQMSLKMRQVLTPAQWQELQKRQPQEWRGRMRGRGEGPPPLGPRKPHPNDMDL